MFDGFIEERIDVGGFAAQVRHCRGSGPAIVLLHGHPRTSATWHRVAPMLRSTGRAVVCPDLRGYGRSDAPQTDADHVPYSKRAMAADGRSDRPVPRRPPRRVRSGEDPRSRAGVFRPGAVRGYARVPPRNLIGKRTRQLLVFAHVAVSVGWMGAGAANVVLAMTAGYTSDLDVARVCYRMIDSVDTFVVIPAAFGALATGVALSVLTRWGLARHWWVLVKLVLTITVIVYSTFGIGAWVEESIAALAAGASESEVAGPLAYGAALNIVAFLFMTWASVAKPWGGTPWSSPSTRRAAATTS